MNQLLTLPPYFIKLPLQVFEVYMCGIKPAESDPDWSEEVMYVLYICTYVHTCTYMHKYHIKHLALNNKRREYVLYI